MAYLRLRQVCLVAPALEPVVSDISAIFGLKVCHRDPNVGRYGLENALFPVGESFIEIVAPTSGGTAAGRFLERHRGQGGYMLILDCDDAERRRLHAEQLGIRVANLIRYEDYLGVQLHPRDTGATMIEFNQTRGGESVNGPYHPAGPNWQSALRTDVTLRLTAVDIEAPDPQAFSARWAALMERPAALSEGRYRIALDGGDIRFSQAASAERQPVFARLELKVHNAAAVLDAAAARRYPVHNGAIALCGVKIAVS
jgi:Glyoxalase-like domain